MRVRTSIVFVSIAVCLCFWLSPSAMAVTTQSASGQSELVPNQVKILTGADSGFDARTLAAKTLMNFRAPEAFEELKKILTDPTHREAQRAIIQAIIERDEPDARFKFHLIDVLLSGDPEIERAAAEALGRFPDRELIQKLKELASNGNPLKQRLAIIDALGKIVRQEAAAALIELWEQSIKEPEAAKQIASAYANSLEGVTGRHYGTNLKAWQNWWASNKSKQPEGWLRARLGRENRTLRDLIKRTEQALVKVLTASFGTGQIAEKKPMIIGHLQNPLPAYRRAALAIIKAGIARAPNQPIPNDLKAAIRQLISDPDPIVRRECAVVFRDSADKAALTGLLEQLKQETDQQVKRELLITLGELGSAEHLETLTGYLASPREPIAIGAAVAIGQVFQNPEVKVPKNLVSSILHRYNQSAGKLKQELLRDMRIIADKQFSKVFRDVMANTDADPDLRLDAVRGLVALNDPQQVKFLLDFIRDRHRQVRVEAAIGIAKLTSDRADIEKLINRINAADEPEKSARDDIWNAVIRWLKKDKHTLKFQLDWAASLLAAANQISNDHRLGLWEVLRVQVDKSTLADAGQRSEDLAKFGQLSMLLQPPRSVEAGKYFQMAMKQAPKPSAWKLAQKIAKNIGTMPETAAEFVNATAGLLEAKQSKTLIENFVAVLQKNPTQIRGFVAKLSAKVKQALPSDYQGKLEKMGQPPKPKPKPKPKSKPKPTSQPASTQATQPGK